MLTAAIAAHPGTSRTVLEVIASNPGTYPGAFASVRLGRTRRPVIDTNDPWFAASAPTNAILSTEDLTVLVNLPDVDEQRRAQIVNNWDLLGVEDYVRTEQASRADLGVLYLRTSRDTFGPTRHRWAALIATHPATAREMSLTCLKQALHDPQVLPADVLVAVDNHHHDPDAVLVRQSGRARQGTLKAVHRCLKSYEDAGGSLPTVLTVAPQTTKHPTDTLAWQHALERTTNPAVIDAFLTTKASPAPMRAALRNPHLPDASYTKLIEAVLANTARYASETLLQAVRVATTRPHTVHGATLDALVNACAPRDLPALTMHPDLTADQLARMLDRCKERITNDLRLRIAAAVSLHPNATDSVRAAAMDTVRRRPNAKSPSRYPRAMLHAANQEPVRVTDLPAQHDYRLFAGHGLTPFMNQVIADWPDLLTNPDLVRAVTVLWPGFDGTVPELLVTAATMTTE